MFKKFIGSVLSSIETSARALPEEETCAQEAQSATKKPVELDPETLHGTHYSIEDFDAEVERRVAAWMDRLGDSDVEPDLERTVRNDQRKSVYAEWTGADSDQVIRWQLANSMAHSGVASLGMVKEEEGDAMLAPIHGISLKDYAAMILKLSQGVDNVVICKAMGIEPAIWEEVNVLWGQRMAEDHSFKVTTLFSQYFAEGVTHPALEALGANVSADGQANLERLRNDRYFYEELCGARQAAYEYGYDGAQWILENFGVSLGDFQAVAVEYGLRQNKEWSSAEIMGYQEYQDQKRQEYAARFAEQQGGNVADDVEF